MAVQVSYPGVYVQETQSNAHSIVGVSTSAAAFVGVFKRGPVDTATRVDDMGDFERTFGGLWEYSEASYAISQFFLNGGQTAWVVRVVGANATASSKSFGPATIAAKSPGSWGGNIEFMVTDGRPVPGTNQPTISLVVRETALRAGARVVVRTERYDNLTLDAGERNIVGVLAHESDLVIATEIGQAGTKNPASLLHSDTKTSPSLKARDINKTGDESEFKYQLEPGDDDLDPNDLSAVTSLVLGSEAEHTGIHALANMAPHIFNLLCIPFASRLDAEGAQPIHEAARKLCEDHRAFYIVDIPIDQDSVLDSSDDAATQSAAARFEAWAVAKLDSLSPNAAVYFPALVIPDPLRAHRPRRVGTSGTMAGVIARTDSDRGVWKAPAGTEAVLRGATPALQITDAENGELNELGFNVLRTFPVYGDVSWGARTLMGADALTSQWKYISVRRLALHIEASLFAGTKWAVFEPNDEPLWSQLRLSVGTFMHDLFRQGAFAGTSADKAYFVRCDNTTTTPSEISRGIVNVVVGFAPLEPAEFVVLTIQQIATV